MGIFENCCNNSLHDYYHETWTWTSHGPTVHQLLSSQSALMFLTMGGCTGATSYYAGSSLSSSGLVTNTGDSLVDVPGGSGAMVRKRSQLIPRDSGSSLGSESSVNQSCAMHHSHTFSTGEQNIQPHHYLQTKLTHLSWDIFIEIKYFIYE